MKSLHQHIEERLIINKNYKISTEDLVEQAINNNTEIVKNNCILFPYEESFLKCLDELGIKYTTDENKKYDNTDTLWVEFKNEFKYSSHSNDTTLICKYARMGKSYTKNRGIVIRLGSVNKSTWLIIQGERAEGYIGMNNHTAEELKNSLITLVDGKNN